MVYHLIAEGVIARTAQNLAAGQYERLAFPGLAQGQRLVARDEAGPPHRHRRLLRPPTDGNHARTDPRVIEGVIEELLRVAAALLDTANDSMTNLVQAGYGVPPQGFYDEAMRLTQLRLRSIGFLT